MSSCSVSIPTLDLSFPLTATHRGRGAGIAGDGSRLWTPAMLMGDPDCVSSSWLQADLVLAAVGIDTVNQ